MGNFFSNAFGNSGSPTQIVTTSPYDQMVQGGQSGNFNNLANTNSTYLADMFSQLGTGQNPSYYQKYQNQAMPWMKNQNAMQYFGTPGNRNTDMYGNPTGMGMASQEASLFGWNPKAQAAQMSKVGQQYMQGSQAIDQYFAGQGYTNMQDSARSLPGWATGQQNSLTSAFEPHTNMVPSVPSSNGWAPGLIASIMGGQNMSSIFNGGGGAGASSGMSGYSGGQNAGFMAQPDLSSGGAPWSFASGGQGFAAAPMMAP